MQKLDNAKWRPGSPAVSRERGSVYPFWVFIGGRYYAVSEPIYWTLEFEADEELAGVYRMLCAECRTSQAVLNTVELIEMCRDYNNCQPVLCDRCVERTINTLPPVSNRGVTFTFEVMQ